MLQHSYKQLEEVYQRGVNKEHKPNPARMHPMSSWHGKGCPDSDQDFDITTVNPNVESMRMDGTHSCPQDSHVPHHTKPKANSMDQHGHQGAPSDLQGLYTGHSRSPASREDEIRHLRSELD